MKIHGYRHAVARRAPRILGTGLLAAGALVACVSRTAPAAGTEAAASGTPRAAGAATSPTRERAVAAAVQRTLARGLADSAYPGAFAIVGTHDRVLAQLGVGHLDWAPSPAPDEHTLWDLASLTKVVGMTSAIMQLTEQGTVDLDAPLQRYLPAWTGPDKQRVTIRQLITHTSGLPAFRAYDQLTHRPDSLAALMFATPLDTVPGARMVYSDIGAYLLGRLVEQVSGETLDAYVRDHVFRPLGMNETGYRPDASLLARIAPTEIDTLRGGLVRGTVHDERAYYLGGVSAHAGIFSSGHDLARFARMYLAGGTLDGVRIFRPETIARFTAYADSGFSNRALGWQKAELPGMRFTSAAPWSGRYLSRAAFGHTGFTGTSIAIDPANDVFIVLLTNRVNPTRRNNKIGAVRRALADAVMTALGRATPAASAAPSSTRP